MLFLRNVKIFLAIPQDLELRIFKGYVILLDLPLNGHGIRQIRMHQNPLYYSRYFGGQCFWVLEAR